MAQELEQGDLLAIFPGNQGTPHNVLLAYPSNSLKLESLNDGYFRKEPDTFLNLVVRDPLDSLEFIERLPSRARADDRWTDTRRQELVVRDSPDYELPRSGCDGIEDVVDAPMSISSTEQENTSTERQSKEVTIETRSVSSPKPRGVNSSERQLNRIGIPVKPDNLQEPLKLQSEKMSNPAKLESSQKALEPASAETNESTSQVQDEPMELDDEQDEPREIDDEQNEPMKIHEQHSSASAPGVQDPATPAPTADLGSIFETEFGVSYDTLVTVNSTGKVQRAEAFFLLFESEILQSELVILHAFLKKHNPVIYTWQQKDDWEKFARAVQVGVVLVCSASNRGRDALKDQHLSRFTRAGSTSTSCLSSKTSSTSRSTSGASLWSNLSNMPVTTPTSSAFSHMAGLYW